MSLHEPSPLTSHESHTCRVRHEAGFPGDRREARVRRCRSCDRGGVGIEAQAFAGVEPAGHGIAVRCSCSWSCPDHAGRPGFGNPNPAPFGASATTAICRMGDAACGAPTALPGCLAPARRARARTTACEHSPQSADSCAIRCVPDRVYEGWRRAGGSNARGDAVAGLGLANPPLAARAALHWWSPPVRVERTPPWGRCLRPVRLPIPPRGECWSRWQGSNLRPRIPKTRALPTVPHRDETGAP